MSITKDQLLAIKTETASIVIPELGGEVHLRSLTGADFDALRKRLMGKHGGAGQDGVVAEFVIAGIADENGDPMFTRADREAVNNMPMRVLMPIFRAVQDHNNIADDDTEELVGN